MKKDYCTQNDQDCRSCSLTNYGRDCQNNPIPANRPSGSKWDRAMANYNGHKGTATVEHVERNIKSAYPTAYAELTGVQYGKLMSVANTSYHDGRNSTGASCEEGLIFVKGEKDMALPLAVARKITVDTERVTTYPTANNNGTGGSQQGAETILIINLLITHTSASSIGALPMSLHGRAYPYFGNLKMKSASSNTMELRLIELME